MTMKAVLIASVRDAQEVGERLADMRAFRGNMKQTASNRWEFSEESADALMLDSLDEVEDFLLEALAGLEISTALYEVEHEC